MIIVLVDDEEDILDIFEGFFEDTDAQVTSFPSAKKALDFIRQNPVDAVVSDAQMPGMSGIGLLKELQGDDDPLFYLITGDVELFRDDFEKYGGFKAFEKPVSLAEVADIVIDDIQKANAKKDGQ